MTLDDGQMLNVALVTLLGSTAAFAGYLFGNRRFRADAEAKIADEKHAHEENVRRLTAEHDIAERAHEVEREVEREASARAMLDVQAQASSTALQRGPIPTIVHTVLLDGVSESGKSTLVHRLAFPCTEADSLRKMKATQKEYRTQVLPICFVPPDAGSASLSGPESRVLHAQVLRDISGEKPFEVVNIINQLAAERGKAEQTAGPSFVTCVLVWDMADTPRMRRRVTEDRLKALYGHDQAVKLIKDFIVFFNKIDLLEVPADRLAQLIEDERDHLKSITGFLGSDVKWTFIPGSAIRGDGVTDCQGAIYTAFGLAPHFRIAAAPASGQAADKDARP